MPFNIEELLTPVAIAHWIMGDGYYDEGCLKICTDNFSRDEVLKLIEVLNYFKIKNSKNQIWWSLK